MVYAGGLRADGLPVRHANGAPRSYMHQSGQELKNLHSFLSDEQMGKKSIHNVVPGDQDPYGMSRSGYGPGGLMFEDLTYTVTKNIKKDGKHISKDIDLLHQVTGFAPKAMVTAVMGPSGAGKSTFLDALAGRIASGSLGGTVKLDGQRVSPTLIKRVSAYVMQDDQLFPMLTVWETLMFAAEVRLGNKVSREEKRMRVVKLVDQLGLNSAQNTFIGDEGHRGVSGGERRRVSIGVDIIHGPSLLFLDEPTSGLDSTSAFSVIEKVHAISQSGSTVILTIHQPSFRIQQLLNHLIVLARGKLVYQGPPSSVSAHLAGMSRKVPKGENSIEYLLDIIQEYDRSMFGVDPLMVYARDGIPPPHRGPLPERTPMVQTTGKSLHAGLVSPGNAAFSPAVVLKPMGSEPRGHEAPINPFLHNFEEHIGALDDYDHSVKSPWVGSAQATPTSAASTYYKGLADTFRLTPKFTPKIRTPVKKSESATNLIQMVGEGAGVHRSRLGNSGLQRNSPALAAHYGGEIGPATPTPQWNGYPAYPEETEDDLSEEDYEPPDYGPKYANTWMAELLVLIRRNFLNIRRTPELFLSRQMVLTVMGAVLATLFCKTHHDPQGVTNLLAFFIFTVCLFFFSSNDAVPAFIQERFIFIRETSHNSYRSSSYVIAGLITYLPFLAVQALTYCLIVWWSLPLGNHGTMLVEIFFFWLVLFISLLTTNSFVMFVSSVVPNYILGYAAVIAFTALFFLTCGYFLKRTAIPHYWIWLHFISTIKYPYEALLLNQFNNPKACYLHIFPDTCGLHGRDILDDLAINLPKSKWQDLGLLLCWGIFYRILFYFVLRFGSKNQRK